MKNSRNSHRLRAVVAVLALCCLAAIPTFIYLLARSDVLAPQGGKAALTDIHFTNSGHIVLEFKVEYANWPNEEYGVFWTTSPWRDTKNLYQYDEYEPKPMLKSSGTSRDD